MLKNFHHQISLNSPLCRNPMSQSKKHATYKLLGILFRIYFKVEWSLAFRIFVYAHTILHNIAEATKSMQKCTPSHQSSGSTSIRRLSKERQSHLPILHRKTLLCWGAIRKGASRERELIILKIFADLFWMAGWESACASVHVMYKEG